jgi:hypothetical protein
VVCKSVDRDYLDGVHRDIFPLMPADYPVHGDKAKILKRETFADSVMTADDFQLNGATAEQYGSQLKPPVFPGSNPGNPYWEQLRKVVQVQIVRRNLGDPNTLNRWPDLWEGYNLDEIAKFVQNEFPASIQQGLIRKLLVDGIRINYDVMPFRSINDFVGLQVRIAAINTWVSIVASTERDIAELFHRSLLTPSPHDIHHIFPL